MVGDEETTGQAKTLTCMSHGLWTTPGQPQGSRPFLIQEQCARARSKATHTQCTHRHDTPHQKKPITLTHKWQIIQRPGAAACPCLTILTSLMPKLNADIEYIYVRDLRLFSREKKVTQLEVSNPAGIS